MCFLIARYRSTVLKFGAAKDPREMYLNLFGEEVELSQLTKDYLNTKG